MPRPLREQVPGATYHVTAHAVAGTKLVRNNRDRQRFFDELAVVVAKYRWTCLAVALLDNHYHLLVTISEPNLAQGMQRLNGVYAALFNRVHGRKGHLFGSRYYSGPVVSTGHLLLTIRYIARNRTAASLAQTPAQDRWSSYGGVIGTQPCWPFVAKSNVLELFGPEADSVRILIDFVEGPADGDAPPVGVRPP